MSKQARSKPQANVVIKFEKVNKMSRLSPEPLTKTSMRPPVKFRTVFFNPNMNEEEDHLATPPSEEFELDEEIMRTDISPDENNFFKDPFSPSFINSEDNVADKDSVGSSKLGHNMRACCSKKDRLSHMTIWDQMAARKQLLDEQRKQHMLYTQQENVEKEATALVNNLLKQGFHITPPDTTPQVTEHLSKMAVSSDNDPWLPVIQQEGDLVTSIRNELKRVQRVTKHQSVISDDNDNPVPPEIHQDDDFVNPVDTETKQDESVGSPHDSTL